MKDEIKRNLEIFLYTLSIVFYWHTGHVCLTDDDKDNAKNNKGSLLYGELLPRGANKVRKFFYRKTFITFVLFYYSTSGISIYILIEIYFLIFIFYFMLFYS